MSTEDQCLFCRISTKLLPADIVAEDDFALAFKDIHPKAPTHILIIPKKHIASLADATDEDAELLGHLLRMTARVAVHAHLNEGYRVIINTKHHGGQEVDHLHIHLLGGTKLGFMIEPSSNNTE